MRASPFVATLVLGAAACAGNVTVVGRVLVDIDDGVPAGNAEVWLTPPRATHPTDSVVIERDGSFSVRIQRRKGCFYLLTRVVGTGPAVRTFALTSAPSLDVGTMRLAPNVVDMPPMRLYQGCTLASGPVRWNWTVDTIPVEH